MANEIPKANSPIGRIGSELVIIALRAGERTNCCWENFVKFLFSLLLLLNIVVSAKSK